MAYNPPPILWKPAAHYRAGRAAAATVKAIVNHRMVGTLPGTTAYFQNPETRPVSTHFGIGFVKGVLQIHQYVYLDDTAFGNGNYDPSGNWDNWGYPLFSINDQTINIEHEDHTPGQGKGVVTAPVQAASMWLQALLLRGDATELYRAGVRFRDNGTSRTRILNQLRAIQPGPRTIITHNDIAGRLKPFCWLPWADDKRGFPAREYIDTIRRIKPFPNAIEVATTTPPPPPPTPAPAPPPATTPPDGFITIDEHNQKVVEAVVEANHQFAQSLANIVSQLNDLIVTYDR